MLRPPPKRSPQRAATRATTTAGTALPPGKQQHQQQQFHPRQQTDDVQERERERERENERSRRRRRSDGIPNGEANGQRQGDSGYYSSRSRSRYVEDGGANERGEFFGSEDEESEEEEENLGSDQRNLHMNPPPPDMYSSNRYYDHGDQHRRRERMSYYNMDGKERHMNAGRERPRIRHKQEKDGKEFRADPERERDEDSLRYAAGSQDELPPPPPPPPSSPPVNRHGNVASTSHGHKVYSSHYQERHFDPSPDTNAGTNFNQAIDADPHLSQKYFHKPIRTTQSEHHHQQQQRQPVGYASTNVDSYYPVSQEYSSSSSSPPPPPPPPAGNPPALHQPRSNTDPSTRPSPHEDDYMQAVALGFTPPPPPPLPPSSSSSSSSSSFSLENGRPRVEANAQKIHAHGQQSQSELGNPFNGQYYMPATTDGNAVYASYHDEQPHAEQYPQGGTIAETRLTNPSSTPSFQSLAVSQVTSQLLDAQNEAARLRQENEELHNELRRQQRTATSQHAGRTSTSDSMLRKFSQRTDIREVQDVLSEVRQLAAQQRNVRDPSRNEDIEHLVQVCLWEVNDLSKMVASQQRGESERRGQLTGRYEAKLDELRQELTRSESVRRELEEEVEQHRTQKEESRGSGEGEQDKFYQEANMALQTQVHALEEQIGKLEQERDDLVVELKEEQNGHENLMEKYEQLNSYYREVLEYLEATEGGDGDADKNE